MFCRFVSGALPAIALAATGAGAQVTTTVTSNGLPGVNFDGSLGVLNDGVYPPNTTYYTTNTVSNFASSIYFDFAFGGPVNIGSYNLTVDNNDDYTIAFFNGATQIASRTILASDGVVTPGQGGVETFSSSPTLAGTYLPSTALFSPLTVTNVRLSASGGDGLYSIGEAEFFPAAISAVPEPATWTMMMLGFGLIGLGYRRSGTRFAVKARRTTTG